MQCNTIQYNTIQYNPIQYYTTQHNAMQCNTIQCNTIQENLKNGKVRFSQNIDARKEKEDSWLNAIKANIVFIKGRLNFNSKSTTAANVHLTIQYNTNFIVI